MRRRARLGTSSQVIPCADARATDFRALDAAADARGILHHVAIRARQALASGYPVPDVGPLALRQAIYEAPDRQ
jgi:hypothetical protein